MFPLFVCAGVSTTKKAPNGTRGLINSAVVMPKCTEQQPSLVFFFFWETGEVKKRKEEGTGRDGQGTQEGRRVWPVRPEHSEPFIQREAGEESRHCAAPEWPHAAAQTHPCGGERALSAEPQTCWAHLEAALKVNTLPALTSPPPPSDLDWM